MSAKWCIDELISYCIRLNDEKIISLLAPLIIETYFTTSLGAYTRVKFPVPNSYLTPIGIR
jgi:hypothetical protein